MFENLSKAMRGNQNARKKTGMAAAIGAIGADLTRRTIAKGSVIAAKDFRKRSLGTAIQKAAAVAAMRRADARVKRAATFAMKSSTDAMKRQAGDFLKKTTQDARGARKALSEVSAIKPDARRSARLVLKVGKFARNHSGKLAIAGAIAGVTIGDTKLKR